MITLDKSMEVGVSRIDEQHRELIDRINTVSAMGMKSVSKEEIQKTLDLLGAYILQHFRDEEELQRRSGFPNYDWHKGQHQVYIDEFEKLKKEFALNGPSAKFLLDLNKSIISWIVKHIKHADAEFGKYYKEATFMLSK